MRSILVGLLAAASLVSATESACSQSALETFVATSSCNCATQLVKCLGAEVGTDQLDRMQQCFTENGCTEAEALKGAAWVAGDCNAGGVEGAQDELRKRATTATSDTTTSATKSKSTSDKTSATTTTQNKAASTTSDSSTSDSSTTTTDSSSSTDSTTSSTTPTSTSTTASTTPTPTSAQTQTTGSSSSTLQCSVTNMVTTTFCSYTSTGAQLTKLGCAPTVTASPTCAPGVICQEDTAGNPVCLLRQNKLTISGTVVAIAFGVAIVGIALAIFILNMKSRASNKRAGMERSALLGGGKGKMVEVPYGQHNPSEANIPLMSPNGTRHENAYPYAQPLEYNPSPMDGSAPRLHPGLGALGQDTNYR